MPAAQADGRRCALLVAVALGLPAVLPLAHGVAGALGAAIGASRFVGGGSLWPGERVQVLLWQGAWLSLLAATLAIAAAAVVALGLMLPHRARWRLALVALLAASFCLGTVVHLMAWRVVFPGVTGGVQGWALAVLVLAGRYLPLAVALLAAGLAVMDRSELETALATGGPRALLRMARGRLLRVGAMAMAAVGTLVFAESELPPLLGVHVYAEEFLSQVALEPDAGSAAALGWPLMAAALLCALALAGAPRLRAAADGSVDPGWLGRWTFAPQPLRRLLPVLALLLAGLPLVLLGWGCLTATGRWPAHAGVAVFNSLWVAAAAAALACLWGLALAEGAVRAGPRVAAALNLVLLLMLLWPSALTGLAIAGSGFADRAGAAAPLILSHTLRVLPFASWVLLALRQVRPTSGLDQLRLLGVPARSAWWHVHLPASAPGLLAAFVLAAGLSLAELSATVLTVPPGMETAILRLYNLLHYGDQRGVMMLALAQALAVAGLMAIGLAWIGRRRAGNR
ncbi:MAG: hypothetical protein JNL87_08625 [Burkholderiaceae bacterium]|nr:hypothetical protein [Burkholderiaceae bacterium]